MARCTLEPACINDSSGFYDRLNFFIFSVEPSGAICKWNRRLSDFTGYSFKEIREIDFWENFFPEEKDCHLRDIFEKVLQGEEFDNIEWDFYTKSGKGVTLLLNLSPFYDENENVTQVMAFGQDITDIKLFNRKQEKRLYLEEMMIGISTKFINITANKIDEEINHALKDIGGFLAVDRCFIDLYSEDLTNIEKTYEWHNIGARPHLKTENVVSFDPFSPSDTGMDVCKRVHFFSGRDGDKRKDADRVVWALHKEDKYFCIPLTVKKKLRGFFGFETRKLKKDFYEENIALLKLMGDIFINLMERKRIASLLNHTASIVKFSNNAIISKDIEGTILSWNKGAEKIYGYREDEVKGKAVSVIIPSDREEEFPEIMKKILSGKEVEPFETIRETKEGASVPVSMTVSPVRNLDGDITGASVIAIDITKRKEVERTLEKRLFMEKVIANISNNFIDLDVEFIDDEIKKAIRSLTEAVKADWCYIQFCNKERGDYSFYYGWSDSKNGKDVTLKDKVNKIGKAVFQDGKVLEPFQINLHGSPEEKLSDIKQALTAIVTGSLLIIPLLQGDRPAGFLGFEMVSPGFIWSNEDVLILNMAGELFSHLFHRKQIEEHKEELILELKKSVDKIKTLKGLIPICASCKKIRDDKGYWHQVEKYIKSHSEADFTHGICPECLKSLYPDLKVEI